MELVDTQDLKSCGQLVRAGSSPAPGTQTMGSWLDGVIAMGDQGASELVHGVVGTRAISSS